MTVKEQMDQLTDELIVHAKKYYEEDAPEISDFEYDALSRHLRQLEQDGVAKVVHPRRPIEMGRLERDPAVLQRVYDQGYAVGQKTEL